MIVEARYARGTGVLIGAGGLWVLMTDPGDERVLQELWTVVSAPAAPGTPATERVLSLVEAAFAGDPPALAMVDLGTGSSATVSRGHGHVRVAGDAGTPIALGEGATAQAYAALAQRLIAGDMA